MRTPYQAGRAHFLQQLGNEHAVRALEIIDLPVGGGRIDSERAGRRGERSKSGRVAAEASLERVAPRAVDDDELHRCAGGIYVGEDRLDAGGVPLDLALGPNLRIDRDDVRLLAALDPVAAEKDERGRPRLDFRLETVEQRAELLLGDILAGHHLEVCPTQFVRDGASVFDRVRKRPVVVAIGRIADHQGDPTCGAHLSAEGFRLSGKTDAAERGNQKDDEATNDDVRLLHDGAFTPCRFGRGIGCNSADCNSAIPAPQHKSLAGQAQYFAIRLSACRMRALDRL